MCKLSTPYKYCSVVFLMFLMCGCSIPDYINSEPLSVVETIPMTEVDTKMKLKHICNEVIVSSASLEQQMTKYLSGLVDSNVDDKLVILSIIGSNLQTIKEKTTEVTSFNPADSLKQKTSDIKLELNNADTYLRNLKTAVEDNDVEGMNDYYNQYMNSIAKFKTMMTGV